MTPDTAALDLDSIRSGGSSQLTTDAKTFSYLRSQFFSLVRGRAWREQQWNAQHSLHLQVSDEDLPGATSGALTLVMQGIVATPGDTNLNNIVDGADRERRVTLR
jgi:hypothetical protein